MTKENKNLFTSAFILGVGLIAALDGIIFHQLLQWHHMILSPNIKLEIITDGLFTALFTSLLIWGGVKMFNDARKKELGYNWKLFISGILIGGGLFNVIEGIIDHHILNVHRVNPLAENPLLYDLAFLASGVLMAFIGFLITRTVKTTEEFK